MTEARSKEDLKKRHVVINKKDSESIDSKKLHFINKLTCTFAKKPTLKDLLKSIMLNINELLKPEFQIIHLFDSMTQRLESYFLDSRKKPEIKKSPLPINERAIMKIIEKEKTVATSANIERYINNQEIIPLTNKIPKSIICAPLFSKGEPVGAIELINKAVSGIFTEEDYLLIESVKDFISLLIEDHLLYEKSLEFSIIDYVSGLYNLKYFKQVLPIEMDRANRELKPFSLVFFDMDFFKKINDSHGHLIGSSVLNRIGDFLKRNLRKTDIAARYGGDEFVIILPRANEANGKIVAERLRKAISNTQFQVKNNLIITITASFGIATYPIHSTDPETLIELSDKAMYTAKKEGRNRVEVYKK